MELTKAIQPTITLTLGQAAAFESLKNVYPEYYDHVGLFERILKCAQHMLQYSGEIYRMRASETRPNDFYITGREFYIVQAKAGSGAQSSAFFVVQITLDGGQTKNMLIKTARRPFKPEVEKLALLSPESKLSGNIDHFKGTFKLYQIEGYLALFEASSCDFCHINYQGTFFPVSFILRQLISVGDGVASFHRADLVLRDIKGANLLANWEDVPGKHPESRPGKVTDFGLVMKLAPEGRLHSTSCTPVYAAPYIWPDICHQKYRVIEGKRPYEGGVQGKASDIFGIGRTIQRDIIPQILFQIAEKKRILEVKPFLEMFLKSAPLLKGKLSDQELLAYERVNPGYVIHLGVDQQGNDILQIFHNENEVLDRTLRAIDYIQDCLDPHEIEKLRGLARLARDLQVTQKEVLLASLGVSKENEKDLLIQAVIRRLHEINGISHSSSTPVGLFPMPAEEVSSPSSATKQVEERASKRSRESSSTPETKLQT